MINQGQSLTEELQPKFVTLKIIYTFNSNNNNITDNNPYSLVKILKI